MGHEAYYLDGIWVFRISSSVEGEGTLVERRVAHGRIHLNEMSVSRGEEWSLWVRIRSSPTAIELAFIIDHKHDLPLENVAVCHSTTDAGYIFISLHLLQLTSKQATGGRSGHGELLQIE